MADDRILVVGAGAAGLSAALELARAGLPVRVVDHAAAPGGAVHRQPLPGARGVGTSEHKRAWQALSRAVAAQGIEITCGTGFAGIDHRGAALLTGAGAGLVRPRALLLATGARERVQPRPGWTLPGVLSAGAIQTRLKTLGAAPEGRILLAGSGPLLLAVGAEFARLGNAPVAIVQAGRPFRPGGLRLPLAYQREALSHLARLVAARVPILSAAHLTAIEATGDGLAATVTTPNGARRFHADLIGLHDGIRPDDTGLDMGAPVPVERAGDCREALGARAALADGRRAGQALAARLLGQPAPPPDAALARERTAQARLATLFQPQNAPALADLPPDTIICRCEARTLADLRALGPDPTARQLRLNGRFAMGPCQGRFCGEWLGRLTGQPEPGRPRLPLRPLAIAELMALEPEPLDGDHP